jgi:hypothetical protein
MKTLKAILLLLLFAGTTFAQEIIGDGLTTNTSYLKIRSTISGKNNVTIKARSYTSATCDTTWAYDVSGYSSMSITVQTQDSATILIKYQLANDTSYWFDLTTIDSLKSGNSGNRIKLDFSKFVAGTKYIRFVFEFSAKAYAMGTSSPTYSAIRKVAAQKSISDQDTVKVEVTKTVGLEPNDTVYIRQRAADTMKVKIMDTADVHVDQDLADTLRVKLQQGAPDTLRTKPQQALADTFRVKLQQPLADTFRVQVQGTATVNIPSTDTVRTITRPTWQTFVATDSFQRPSGALTAQLTYAANDVMSTSTAAGSVRHLYFAGVGAKIGGRFIITDIQVNVDSLNSSNGSGMLFFYKDSSLINDIADNDQNTVLATQFNNRIGEVLFTLQSNGAGTGSTSVWDYQTSVSLQGGCDTDKTYIAARVVWLAAYKAQDAGWFRVKIKGLQEVTPN